MSVSTGKCTLGIDGKSVQKAGGLLPFLMKNGLRQLLRIDASWGVFKPVAMNPEVTTKYTRIRNRINQQIEVHASDVDLADLIDDLQIHGLPLDGQIKRLRFVDPINKKHTYTLTREGKNSYRVSEIDDLNVYTQFNPQKVEDIYTNGFFEKIDGLFCDIQRSKLAKWEIKCKPRPKEKPKDE